MLLNERWTIAGLSFSDVAQCTRLILTTRSVSLPWSGVQCFTEPKIQEVWADAVAEKFVKLIIESVHASDVATGVGPNCFMSYKEACVTWKIPWLLQGEQARPAFEVVDGVAPQCRTRDVNRQPVDRQCYFGDARS